jgi:hypothetical protein
VEDVVGANAAIARAGTRRIVGRSIFIITSSSSTISSSSNITTTTIRSSS